MENCERCKKRYYFSFLFGFLNLCKQNLLWSREKKWYIDFSLWQHNISGELYVLGWFSTQFSTVPQKAANEFSNEIASLITRIAHICRLIESKRHFWRSLFSLLRLNTECEKRYKNIKCMHELPDIPYVLPSSFYQLQVKRTLCLFSYVWIGAVLWIGKHFSTGSRKQKVNIEFKHKIISRSSEQKFTYREYVKSFDLFFRAQTKALLNDIQLHGWNAKSICIWSDCSERFDSEHIDIV